MNRPSSDVPHPSSQPWHQSVSFLAVALLVVGPLAIPLIWFNRKIPFLMKIAFTVLVAALTWWTVRFSTVLLERLQRQLAELRALSGP